MPSLEISERLLRYPLDLTGVNPDNFVENEVRDLPVGLVNRAVVLSNGAFYSDSLVVRDNTTGLPLTKRTQYIAAQLVDAATVRSGKEVCSIIIVIDPAVSNQISVDYQAIGGPYILNVDALVEMLATIDIDNRPVVWGEIIGKPSLFPPGHHLHDTGDVFGFEYLVLAVEEIRKAIIMGDIASHDEIRAYIGDVEIRVNEKIDLVDTALTDHKQLTNNPHSVTKAQVGLDNVANYGIATQVEAEAGTAVDKYMTPQRVAQAITALAAAALSDHISDTNNPHQVDKSDVGLGSVANYSTATQLEAEAGTVSNKYMTPLLTKQAITSQVGTALSTHVGLTNNPHSVTKAQVGLSAVGNYGIATKLEAEAGASNILYMTPLRVKEAIANQTTTLATSVSDHIGSTLNPHSVTKSQVGLNNVENYGVATKLEAEAGTANNKYMTPLRVKEAIDALALSSSSSYVLKGVVTSDTSLTVSNGELYAAIGGVWKKIWPPQWQ